MEFFKLLFIRVINYRFQRGGHNRILSHALEPQSRKLIFKFYVNQFKSVNVCRRIFTIAWTVNWHSQIHEQQTGSSEGCSIFS